MTAHRSATSSSPRTIHTTSMATGYRRRSSFLALALAAVVEQLDRAHPADHAGALQLVCERPELPAPYTGRDVRLREFDQPPPAGDLGDGAGRSLERQHGPVGGQQVTKAHAISHLDRGGLV